MGFIDVGTTNRRRRRRRRLKICTISKWLRNRVGRSRLFDVTVATGEDCFLRC